MIDALVHAWIGLAILALIALAHGLIGGMPTVATLPTVQRSVVEYVDDPERTTITTWRVLPAERSRVPLDAAAAPAYLARLRAARRASTPSGALSAAIDRHTSRAIRR